MSQLPEDVINLSLDAIGYPEPIGSLTEGTKAANVCLRRYSQAIKELARAAHWDAFRRIAPLTLLADATGQTANVGTVVIEPWQYEYAYPNDCLKARFVPMNLGNTITSGIPPGNIAISQAPLPYPVMPVPRQVTAKFLVANDVNYPPVPQPSGNYNLGVGLTITSISQANPCVIQVANNLSVGSLVYLNYILGMSQLNGNTYQILAASPTSVTLADAEGNPVNSTGFGAYTGGGQVIPISLIIPSPNHTQWWNVQGQSPIGRTVICTNVQNASLVYTAYLPYPSLWDVLFRSALVAYIASEIAMALIDDKDKARILRDEQIKIAKMKIDQARISDGNEGSYSSDIQVDWMNIRNAGRHFNGYGSSGLEGGSFGYGWDSIGFSDGSAF